MTRPSLTGIGVIISRDQSSECHAEPPSHGAASSDYSPVLTAPVSAAPALFVTVGARPSPFRPVKIASRRRWSVVFSVVIFIYLPEHETIMLIVLNDCGLKL